MEMLSARKKFPVTIIKVISEHKKRPAHDTKRVQAVVKFADNGSNFIRHCDTKDGVTGLAYF